MGDPKRQRRKYETPRFPWRADTQMAELTLIGQYGLRNKREFWRHKTMLSRFRGIARELLGKPAEERGKQEGELIGRLHRIGVLPEEAGLDDVLDLGVESILERRLQTVVFRRGLAGSVQQARQLVVHGHIAIGGRKVVSPGYLVMKEEEASLAYAPTSPLLNPDHPLLKPVAPETRKPERRRGGPEGPREGSYRGRGRRR